MSEDSPTCRIHEKYRLIECANTPLTGDPQGFCILHSENKAKDQVAFREALRARWVQADAKRFDFRGVWFPVRFERRDYFGTGVFDKPVDFSWACFAEAAIFSWAIFKEDADFLRARFIGEAHFYRTVFGRRARFNSADFGGEADFYAANFAEPADFRRVKIQGRMLFKGGYEPERPPAPRLVFPRWGDFRFLQLGPEAVLRFQDLSLERVEFAGNDLCRVEFFHVHWHPYRGRQAIYDEVLLRQEEKNNPWFLKWLLYYAPYANPPSPWGDKYGEVERLYRYLKINYERQHDYKNAGDFHYGEMEMHRRASKWRWFTFYWYSLYWFLSGYGERPLRALICLLGLILGLPLLISWLGLHPVVDCKVSPALASWKDTLVFLLEKAALQRPDWLAPDPGGWARFWTALSALALPGQAALFLLALRNRLGRRR